MPDIPFTFPNGVRGTLSEDGKISLLGKAATEEQRPSALSGPGATDSDGPSGPLGPQGQEIQAGPASGPEAPAEEPGLTREDPIGDTLVSAALGGPTRDLVAKGGEFVASKAAPAVANVIRKVVQPSAAHAVAGAVEAAAPTLYHTGDPLAAGKAAVGGAVVGGLVGKAGHKSIGKLIKHLVNEGGEEAAGRAIADIAEGAETPGTATEASPAPAAESAPAPVPTPPAGNPFPRAISKVDMHLANLSGPSGEAGAAALKAVALRPSRETLAAAVAAGVPLPVAMKVAKLGAQLGGVQ